MANPHPSNSIKPGETRNPKGRPKKGYSITDWFQGMFKSNPKIKDKLGKAILDKAIKGDPTAVKLVWNYMDGMPQQKTDITTLGKQLPVPILGGLSVKGRTDEGK